VSREKCLDLNNNNTTLDENFIPRREEKTVSLFLRCMQVPRSICQEFDTSIEHYELVYRRKHPKLNNLHKLWFKSVLKFFFILSFLSAILDAYFNCLRWVKCFGILIENDNYFIKINKV